jgi:hypothetical protein
MQWLFEGLLSLDVLMCVARQGRAGLELFRDLSGTGMDLTLANASPRSERGNWPHANKRGREEG